MVERISGVSAFTMSNTSRVSNGAVNKSNEPILSFKASEPSLEITHSDDGDKMSHSEMNSAFVQKCRASSAQAREDGEKVGEMLFDMTGPWNYDEILEIILRQKPETIMTFLDACDFVYNKKPYGPSQCNIMDEISNEWFWASSGKNQAKEHIRNMALAAVVFASDEKALNDPNSALSRLHTTSIDDENIDKCLYNARKEVMDRVSIPFVSYGDGQFGSYNETYFDENGYQRDLITGELYYNY